MESIALGARRVLGAASAAVGAAVTAGAGAASEKMQLQKLKRSATFRVFAAIALDRVIGRDAMSRVLCLYLPVRQFLLFNRAITGPAPNWDGGDNRAVYGSFRDILDDTDGDDDNDGDDERRRRAAPPVRSAWDALPAEEKDHTLRYALALLASLVVEAAAAHAVGALQAVTPPRVSVALSRVPPLAALRRVVWSSGQLQLLRAALFVGLWVRPQILRSAQDVLVGWLRSCGGRNGCHTAASPPLQRSAAALVASSAGRGARTGFFWDRVVVPGGVVPVAVDDDSDDDDDDANYDFDDASSSGGGGGGTGDRGKGQEAAAADDDDDNDGGGGDNKAARRISRGFSGSSEGSSGGVRIAVAVAAVAGEATGATETRGGISGSVAGGAAGVHWLQRQCQLQRHRQQECELGATPARGTAADGSAQNASLSEGCSSQLESGLAEQLDWAARQQRQQEVLTRQAPTPANTPARPVRPSRDSKPRPGAWLGAGRPSVGYNRLLDEAAAASAPSSPSSSPRAVDGADKEVMDASMCSLDLAAGGGTCGLSSIFGGACDDDTGIDKGSDDDDDASGDGFVGDLASIVDYSYSARLRGGGGGGGGASNCGDDSGSLDSITGVGIGEQFPRSRCDSDSEGGGDGSVPAFADRTTERQQCAGGDASDGHVGDADAGDPKRRGEVLPEAEDDDGDEGEEGKEGDSRLLFVSSFSLCGSPDAAPAAAAAPGGSGHMSGSSNESSPAAPRTRRLVLGELNA